MIRKIFRKLKNYYYHSSNERFGYYLKKKGVQIGNGCVFRPQSTLIDLTRPSLVTIGDNCYFNENFTLLTHDWVTRIFIYSEREFIPSSGRVIIGNNVSTGLNVMILKGVEIGDNVFIGANSVVTNDIPANSIAVGAPARVICSLDAYYEKRKKDCINEALDYARSIKERYGRNPVTTDFWEEFPLFVSGDQVDVYPELKDIIKRQLGPSYEKYITNHKAYFNGFEEFIKATQI